MCSLGARCVPATFESGRRKRLSLKQAFGDTRFWDRISSVFGQITLFA